MRSSRGRDHKVWRKCVGVEGTRIREIPETVRSLSPHGRIFVRILRRVPAARRRPRPTRPRITTLLWAGSVDICSRTEPGREQPSAASRLRLFRSPLGAPYPALHRITAELLTSGRPARSDLLNETALR